MRAAQMYFARLSLLLIIGILLSTAGVAAQDDLAAAGNGGTSEASANGGAAAIGDITSGMNAGNAVGIGDTAGDALVSGGAVANVTEASVDVEGGTAIGDASGGDDNIGFTEEFVPAPDNDAERDFIVCVHLAGNPTVCGTGSCERNGGELQCFPDDCQAIDPSFEDGCVFGVPTDPCVKVNDNRARCDVIVD